MENHAKKLVETARNEGMGGVHRRLRDEATRRGHAQQTAFAGAGGLLGGLIGSFRGPWGAALGALLGALFGGLLGRHRDRNPAVGQLPRGRARTIIRRPPVRDYVDVHYRT